MAFRHRNMFYENKKQETAEIVGSEDAGGGGGSGGSGLDLLGLLQLHNGSSQGVTLTQGPHRMRPAYYLQEIIMFRHMSNKNPHSEKKLNFVFDYCPMEFLDGKAFNRISPGRVARDAIQYSQITQPIGLPIPDLDFFITSGLRGNHSLSQVLNDLSCDHSPVLLTTSLDPILDYRELRLPDFAYKKAVELLHHSTEFTLSASIKQELYNSGTILAFSDGVNRYLEVQSSGRKNEIRLHYTSQQQEQTAGWTVRVETFPYRLADLSWHKLSVSVSGSQVQVLVDCHPLYRRLLSTPIDTNFSRPSLALWVGQRNARHSLFKRLEFIRRVVKLNMGREKFIKGFTLGTLTLD
ncbi:hypothetical protein AAG570_005621 [Ranatra chinensis]|uniref:Thrombospondin-like N-terminal domain-containing protein n=1 Tax=Ranatra chinensis TaxID=642074 RepID=A0ABD0XXY2_9HEMI